MLSIIFFIPFVYALPTCIVGGGSAGLSAANSLLQSKKPFVLLEARTRAGGRVWSDSPTGVIVDLGAAWLEGAVQSNPIFQLATSNGAIKDTYKSNWDNSQAWYSNGGDASRDEDKAYTLWDDISSQVSDSAGPGNLQTYLSSAISKLSQDDQRLVNWTTALEVVNEYAADPAWLSATNYDSASEFDSSKQLLWKKGYFSAFAPLVKQLENAGLIKYGQVVKSITKVSNGATIVTKDSIKYSCGKVILAVPLGVLKANSIAISPPLAPVRQAAIKALGFGIMNKVVLTFPSGSLKKIAPSTIDFVEIVPAKGTTGLSTWQGYFEWINLRRFTTSDTLICLVSGSFGKRMETLSSDQLLKEVMQIFKSIDPTIPTPKLAVSKWFSDPYTLGSYSYMTPGTSGKTYRDLRDTKEPNDWILIAGEHASWPYPSTVHGAWFSGIVAAGKV